MTMETIVSEYSTLWMLVCIALVFFMQGGFAMVETGLTRAKNAGNIIMKNLMDFSIGTVAFVLIGYGLLCGDSIGGFIGKFTNTFADFGNLDVIGFMFNLVFCATAATIVSGAMAERTKFSSYCLYSILITALVYPIQAHWIWNSGGWLFELGFVDFAGSTAVHMVGGVAALVGAAILGPRIGKYTVGRDGKKKVNAIPGHSLTLAALGVFILWFAWYGFNGAAAGNATHAGQIFTTTTVSAAVATVATMIFTWIKNGKPDVSMSLNGALAGLVAITAGCASVNVVGATVIGLVAGIVVVLAVEFIDKKLKVDDPVGAISVHGVCGALGTVLVGLFDINSGAFYGGGFSLLGVQILGVAAVAVWVAVTMSIVFFTIKKTVGLRVSEKVELEGLDSTEHGIVSSYADFVSPAALINAYTGAGAAEVTGSTSVEEAIPIFGNKEDDPHSERLSKVDIIINANRFDVLKRALEDVDVTGMTVMQVMGCGTQKGADKYYRGVPVSITLLPKMQVELVVPKSQVPAILAVAKKALYTGNIGDGKIFVYDVENVVRIRTGEEGCEAIQNKD